MEYAADRSAANHRAAEGVNGGTVLRPYRLYWSATADFRLEIRTSRKHTPVFTTGPPHGDLLSVVVPLYRLDPELQQRQIWTPTDV